MRALSRRWLVLALSGLFVVAACSSGSSPSPSAEASAAPSAEASASAAPEFQGTKEFTVAGTSIGLSTAAWLAAIDSLNQQGWKITYQTLDASELVTEGVAKGDFAFGSGANNSMLAAIEKGANLRVLMSRIRNEWTLYARKGINTCADLAGKKLAIHSQGAVSTAMVKNYIATVCPGTEPEYVVIEGSPNRVAAMLADQIDASPLELSDAVKIDTEAGDRFSLLTSFAKDLPDLQTTSIYANGDFVRENPDTILEVVKAVLAIHKQIEGNAAFLKEIVTKYVPDLASDASLDAKIAKYIELGMFPVDGGVTEANLAYTAEFFGPDGTGSTKAVVPNLQSADLSFLEKALAGS